jgi:GMP synthase (glutamine-hydrolysing)
MKTCLAFRHVAFEDAGTLAPILAERGFDVRYVDLGIDDLDRSEITGCDLLVVLGGPIGVYEQDDYPFLKDEIAAIGDRLAAMRPTLGVCLGAQLIASALGAKVAPGPAKEIGWAPLELTASGRRSPLCHLEGVPVLHWHGDNFQLPPATEHLARTVHCPFQAFSKGPNLLAMQFHIETDAQRIESWLIGHTVELRKAQINPNAIREDTARYGGKLQQTASVIVNEWLNQIAR